MVVDSRYVHVDAMRALAVLLVVVAHAGLAHLVPGGSGVTMFFVISGFIISSLALRERDRTSAFDLRGFYLRRTLKLLPPLLVIIMVPTALYAFSHTLDGGAVASQVFFFYNWYMAGGDAGGVLPGSQVLWSLAIEEQFYVVFALLWLGLARRTRPTTWLLGIAVLVVVAANVQRVRLADDPIRVAFGTDTRIDAIAIGILAALAIHHWQSHPDALPRMRRALSHGVVPVLAALAYLASLGIRDPWFRETLRYFVQAVAASGVLVFGLLASGTFAARALFAISTLPLVQLIGRSSYSIYLVHGVVFAQILPVVDDRLPLWPRVTFLTVVGVGLGVVIYLVVEKPFERLRRALDRRDGSGSPALETRAARA